MLPGKLYKTDAIFLLFEDERAIDVALFHFNHLEHIAFSDPGQAEPFASCLTNEFNISVTVTNSKEYFLLLKRKGNRFEVLVGERHGWIVYGGVQPISPFYEVREQDNG